MNRFAGSRRGHRLVTLDCQHISYEQDFDRLGINTRKIDVNDDLLVEFDNVRVGDPGFTGGAHPERVNGPFTLGGDHVNPSGDDVAEFFRRRFAR
jgi:hypothetical protein